MPIPELNIFRDIQEVGEKHEDEMVALDRKKEEERKRDSVDIPITIEQPPAEPLNEYIIEEVRRGDYIVADKEVWDINEPYKFIFNGKIYFIVIPRECDRSEIGNYSEQLIKLGYNIHIMEEKDPTKLNAVTQQSPIKFLKMPPEKLLPHANSADYDLGL